MANEPTMPPHVTGVSIEPERILIEFSADFDTQVAVALGGRQRSRDLGAWEFAASGDKAAGAVLEALRDRGVPFRHLDGGWPPTAVFEELRERGLVAGQVRALSFHGSGRWKVRDV